MLEHSESVFSLTPSFSEVLRAMGTVRETLVMARNEHCVLGTVARPLVYSEAGHRALAWSKDITLQISGRRNPEVLAYHERGDAGVEFFDKSMRGFLKIFRAADAPRISWQEAVASVAEGVSRSNDLSKFRKTNHLGTGVLRDGDDRPGDNEAGRRVDEFFAEAISRRRLVEILAPCGMVRGILRFLPQQTVWKGEWLFVIAAESGCHIRISEGFVRFEGARAGGMRCLDLFDANGKFTARLTSRPPRKKQQ